LDRWVRRERDERRGRRVEVRHGGRRAAGGVDGDGDAVVW
jgi:hypothetical protein